MSTRNADSVAVPARYDTEKVCTFKHRDSACSCGYELGVVSHDSGSVYDKVSTLNIFCSLTYENGNTHFSYSIKGLGLIIVRACKVVALRVEYLCKRVHTRTAYAYEMNVLFTV